MELLSFDDNVKELSGAIPAFFIDNPGKVSYNKFVKIYNRNSRQGGLHTRFRAGFFFLPQIHENSQDLFFPPYYPLQEASRVFGKNKTRTTSPDSMLWVLGDLGI